jgi:type VI secretion system protein ImpL
VTTLNIKMPKGTTLAIVAVVLAASAYIWIDGEELNLVDLAQKWRAQAFVLGVAIGLLSLREIVNRIKSYRLSRQFDAEHHRAAPDAATTSSVAAATKPESLKGLQDALRDRHRGRWRYRQPWLLLVGEPATIHRFLPGFAERSWMVTADAVLLWRKPGADGRPDEAWLQQIYRMRRQRPVDGIVLALNGEVALPETSHDVPTSSVNLGRVIENLHWSAPIFVLDLADTDSINSSNALVIGSEFSRTANTAAIDAALCSLRDRLADDGIKRIAHNRDDRFVAALSERLDTRGAILARWVTQLSSRSFRTLPVSGVFFAAWPSIEGRQTVSQGGNIEWSVWCYLAQAAQRNPGHRLGLHPVTVLSVLASSLIVVWGAGMAISGITNAHQMVLTNEALASLDHAPDRSVRSCGSSRSRAQTFPQGRAVT